ncbi:MAG: phenylalanine--tRNA ligase subunit beta [bacterium]
MLFSYNLLQSYFNKKLPKPDTLVELLTMRSFEVEEIKKIGNDWLLNIDVLSNRGPDCFSHIGMARECSTFLGIKLEVKNKIKEDKSLLTKDLVSVKMDEPCLRYTARAIVDVNVGPSPKWLQERLITCGQRPINNIVDAANYVMLETGQPLHAFDLAKISSRLIVRKAKENEEIISLDNDKYVLDENVLVIADEEGPLAIAGIKGGVKAEITSASQNIVLESANFDYQKIRITSHKIKLKTDASWRFEHNLDPNLTEFAIDRLAGLIQEIGQGKIAKGLIDFYPKKTWPQRVKLDLNYTQRLLGVNIPKKTIIKILRSLDFRIIKEKKTELLIEIPTFRRDISIPEDLIEEIGRLYGYENIKDVFPSAALIPPQKNIDLFWENNIKDILKEIGLTEIYNYSFISPGQADIFKFSNLAEIENPVSLEQKYLRPSLVPNLLENIRKNLDYFNEIQIFELGKIFKDSSGLNEEKSLAGVFAKKNSQNHFYSLKVIADSLLSKLGINNVVYKECQEDILHSKRCTEMRVNGKKIGILGEISAKLLDNLKIKEKVAVFEFDFAKLKEAATEELSYTPICRFPSVVRDVAVLVPRETRIAEVMNKIDNTGGQLVFDVDIFDIYEGDEISGGKKNLAFHIIYQAEDRTLTGKEVDEIQNKIIAALEEEPDWEVRK